MVSVTVGWEWIVVISSSVVASRRIASAPSQIKSDAVYDEKTNPACVYMMPEAASVGLTEEKCREKGIDYKVGKFVSPVLSVQITRAPAELSSML